MKNTYPFAFVTSHGHHDTWCGGQESHLQILRQLGNRVLSITAGPHGISRRLRESGLPLYVVPFDPDLVYGFSTAKALRKLRVLFASGLYCLHLYRALKRFRVKVVYTVIGPAVILAPLAVKLAGARLVTGVRGTPLRIARRNWVLRLSDRIAVLSEEMKDLLMEELRGNSIPNLESKIKVIFNGVELDQAQRKNQENSNLIRRSLGVGDEDLLILYPAAFRSWKGQLRFIKDVLPLVIAQGHMKEKSLFVFLGSADNEGEERYERTCREAARDSTFCSHVHFAGFQSHVWPWYQAADIVVLASENLEGMARVIIEAMACAKPVVCYDVCSARELLDASGAGIVVPQGDARGMASAIANLGKSFHLREEMGKRSKEFAATHLDIRAVSKAYERMFQELLEEA